MKKSINTKPLEILTLEFEDDKTINMMFNNYAMMTLDEEFEGFTKVISDIKDRPYLNGAKLIYAGVKGYDFYKNIEEPTNFNDIKKLIVNMEITDLLEIVVIANTQIISEDKAKNLKSQLVQVLNK